jgi:DNA processing protein
MNDLALAVFASETGAHLVRPPSGRAWRTHLRSFDPRSYVQRLATHGFRFLQRCELPPLLAALHDPPPGLFLRGAAEPELLARTMVAIVGARSCTDYGAHVARRLAGELAAAGIVVVSGLARGVDGYAHRGALDAGRETVAVLGCGIDRDYPRAHTALAAQIASTGLIVSEYPSGVAPAPWRFPARNRIVAGLAEATLVVEARERSGALITADLALEEGRDVMAVPGEITSGLSRGTNALLRVGAVPVTCVEDVLEVLGIEAPSQPRDEPPPGAPRCVLAAIDGGAQTADEILRATGLAADAVAAALTELELCALVRASAGVYRR